MNGDCIETKTIEVGVQANGIIRNKKGWIIGRLSKEVSYEKVDGDNDPYKDARTKKRSVGEMMKKREVGPVTIGYIFKVYGIVGVIGIVFYMLLRIIIYYLTGYPIWVVG